MRNLKPEPLSPEAFAPYGEYVDLKKTGAEPGFYPDRMQLPLGVGVPTVGVAAVGDNRRVDMLEYHKFTSEGLMPLDGDCDIFVGSPIPGNHFGAELRAFRIPCGTFVRLNPGTIHGSQYSVTGEKVNVLLILPAFTFGNDTEIKMLGEEEQFDILL